MNADEYHISAFVLFVRVLFISWEIDTQHFNLYTTYRSTLYPDASLALPDGPNPLFVNAEGALCRASSI